MVVEEVGAMKAWLHHFTSLPWLEQVCMFVGAVFLAVFGGIFLCCVYFRLKDGPDW